MTKIAIILGSTRPGRIGEQVAKWVLENAKKRSDAEFELVDVADYDLPLLDEPMPPGYRQYTKDHTFRWSEKIEEFDGFIMVTAEYNHGIPGALKNAIDYLFEEWNHKAVGFVSYGSAMGVRSVEHLRLVSAELMMADVRQQVMLSLFTDFEDMSKFKPQDYHLESLNSLFDQVIAWSNALKVLRK
ncbi:MAG: NADPH-dependent FMN reductase [Tissierellaceae bacterium]|jgi:NAD(P)H-dependent FMN reductase|nr:NAD(P)H-dependent oxidoreductase [Tissierellia bacterium]